MKLNSIKKIGFRELSLIIAILILFIISLETIDDMINVDFYKSLFYFIFGDTLIPILIIISIYFSKTKIKKWRYFLTVCVITYFIIGIISNYTSFGTYHYTTNEIFQKWDIYIDLIAYFIVCLCMIYKKYLKLVDIICFGGYVFGLTMFIYNIRLGDTASGLFYVAYYMAWPLMFIFIYPKEGYSKVLSSKSGIGKLTRILAVIIIATSFIFAILRLIMINYGLFENTIIGNNFEIIIFSVFIAITWFVIIYYNNHIDEEDMENKKRLEKTYKNNEVLLTEVHHRVKNNLTVLYSFINLEKRKKSNQESLESLSTIQNRIMAMTLVHSNLYETLDFGEVTAKKYINELVSNIHRSMNREDIIFDLDIKDINIDIDIISPLGLIINESVTNSFKYAFPEQGGTISIQLKENENICTLIVKDNRIGCSEEDLKSNPGTGSMIIKVLVSQIDGKMNLSVDNGVKRTITFENKLKKHIDIA